MDTSLPCASTCRRSPASRPWLPSCGRLPCEGTSEPLTTATVNGCASMRVPAAPELSSTSPASAMGWPAELEVMLAQPCSTTSTSTLWPLTWATCNWVPGSAVTVSGWPLTVTCSVTGVVPVPGRTMVPPTAPGPTMIGRLGSVMVVTPVLLTLTMVGAPPPAGEAVVTGALAADATLSPAPLVALTVKV